VRVVSWNVLHGLDLRTGRVDLGAVAAGIAALAADVVAVQEVDRGLDRTGGIDQVAELASRLGWHGLFAPALLGDPARRWAPGPGGGADPGGPAYGVGLLSPHPLLDPRRLALPGGGAGQRHPDDAGRALPCWDHEPRVVLRARMARPDGPDLLVASTHLSYLAWRGVRQLRVATSWTPFAAGPALLMGDLNLPLRALRPALAASGWAPVAAAPTFPSWRPGMQLDHLLVRGTRLREVRVGPPGPSDHLPVSAEIIPS
jgi:endonuclease/exonuclease/phosphatase family metal-dependent hydrolase